jgi:hypothetical protein
MAGMRGTYIPDPGAQSRPFETPPTYVNISDIERLAKAGVQISLSNIAPQQDPYPPEPHPYNKTLADRIWDRWHMARMGANPHYRDGMAKPFQLLASQHNDKVWVSVHPTNFSYEPFQLQDDAAIFPSDTLMANIALWEKNHPSGGS